MSAQPLQPLHQGANEGESDSEYLSTPVDPPASVQPHVAEYGPLGDYYYQNPVHSAGYGAVGYPVPQYRYSEPNSIETSAQPNLLFGQAYYEPAIPDAHCARSDSTMTAYHWMGAAQVVPSPSSDRSSSSVTDGLTDSPRDDSSPSLAPATRAGEGRLRCSPASLQYPEYDGEPGVYGDIVPNVSSYAIARSRQPDLVCNTNLGYSLAGNQRSHSSPDHTVLPAAASFPPTYFDEGYSESPLDDSLQCDPFLSSGCAVERSCGYDGQSQPRLPHLDAHLSGGHMPIRHSVRFYKPPSCPYSYPLVDGPLDGPGAYSSDALSALGYPHSVIHAPRPQQLHGLHSLHGGPCSAEDAPALVPAHQVLSIPNGPMQPIPRPSSLIEDNPKKPLTLACFFCRKRKIACQSPPASSPDRTCNQCAKRKLKCVYPATSRRGIRPRVYDLQDDLLPRPSAPLSL